MVDHKLARGKHEIADFEYAHPARAHSFGVRLVTDVNEINNDIQLNVLERVWDALDSSGASRSALCRCRAAHSAGFAGAQTSRYIHVVLIRGM